MVGTTQHTTPAGFWTSEKGKNMRAAFENFAMNLNFEPLVAENWYRVSRQALLTLPVPPSLSPHPVLLPLSLFPHSI
jgi:hypothetical protein